MRKIYVLLAALCCVMTASAIPGALTGKFSTNSTGTKAIRFSQGNLQYQASTNTWRFATHQYDTIGKDNEKISETYNGWIDLFGWGTSGYNNKFPYMNSVDPANYGAGVRVSITNTEYDWGVHNAISNGGNTKGVWRTLDYELASIIKNRPNADKLFGFGTVNGVHGLILLPDDWTDPNGLPAFKPALENGLAMTEYGYLYENPNNDNFSHNTYTEQEWNNIMQANGAVFLPVTGYRLATTCKGVSEEGKIEMGGYWTTQYPGWTTDSYVAEFNSFAIGSLVLGNAYSEGTPGNNFHYGYAVRLIKDYETSTYYTVTITQPAHGKISVQETGVNLSAVASGTTLHFVATPDEGYELDAWSGCAADGSLTVNAAATVTCTFKKKTFKVTFVDWNDAVLKAAQTVEWGAAAVPPAEPTREGYKFTGWDTDFSSVKSDLTVKAKYEEVDKTVYYTVTYYDWDLTILGTEKVEEGKDAKGWKPEPTREGYVFIGWSKPLTNITADLSVQAMYEEKKVWHTVTYYDWDLTILGTEKVEEGKDAKGLEPAPTREGYVFIGWSKPLTNITADISVQALYEARMAIDETEADSRNQKTGSRKLIRDGQLLIIRNGKMYNAQGTEIQ